MSKIDIHHHVYPPVLVEALKEVGGDSFGWQVPPPWTLEKDQEIMARMGAEAAILSITSPGVCFVEDTDRAARLARQCNEFAAAIRDERPGKYGFFATLPSLCDTQAALDEINYALGILKADGVTIFAQYGDEHHYLGHTSFHPIWAELSRLKAVVFVHPTFLPTSAAETRWVNSYMPLPILDYSQETGRTAMDLIVSGVMKTYPGCKVILSHAGGTLPYLIHRNAALLASTPNSCGQTQEEILDAARKFYFDTALAANHVSLSALFAFAEPGHILFGSDFPNAPGEVIDRFTGYIDSELSGEQHSRISYLAALELFPRLKPFFEETEIKRPDKLDG
ncbi:uncharacterized protein GIQ15_00616 [Arthroderma uncinatum]|uniref:uncharacterized protein n=1 Tax=Arthroderma uncinatum TaxID=74035 RepID=UPI00144AC5E9|nr:uncharacterized protein GIQ15_00616 [Arthroderma uncinatum]KAF3491099.1 hypothetical protein GIQ15_00616 [Arthroderma uncinatum]